jgi:hypothetical protein
VGAALCRLANRALLPSMAETVLTRRELYDLVWSVPMTKAAERLRMSAKGSGELCRRCGVPTPPRGYWAKKAAGKSVAQTPLIESEAKPKRKRPQEPSSLAFDPQRARDEQEERAASGLQRRRQLAERRRVREAARVTFLDDLMAAEDPAAKLRAWLPRAEAFAADGTSQEFSRMVAWARDHLTGLERQLAPGAVQIALQFGSLFPTPAEDSLSDPLGAEGDQPW